MSDIERYKIDKDIILNYDHENPPRHGSCCYAEVVAAREFDSLQRQYTVLRDENERYKTALTHLANGADQHPEHRTLYQQFLHDEEWWIHTQGDRSFYRWFAYKSLALPEQKGCGK